MTWSGCRAIVLGRITISRNFDLRRLVWMKEKGTMVLFAKTLKDKERYQIIGELNLLARIENLSHIPNLWHIFIIIIATSFMYVFLEKWREILENVFRDLYHKKTSEIRRVSQNEVGLLKMSVIKWQSKRREENTRAYFCHAAAIPLIRTFIPKNKQRLLQSACANIEQATITRLECSTSFILDSFFGSGW